METNRLLSEENFHRLTKIAQESSRGRTNYNFHELHEVYQRFLNILTLDTYIQPHKHSNKPETFIALKGKIGCFLFDDSGKITTKQILSSEGPVYGIDILPNTWHTIVCLSENAACFEGKSGPYNPETDKEFANWAPAEGESNVMSYLIGLKQILFL